MYLLILLLGKLKALSPTGEKIAVRCVGFKANLENFPREDSEVLQT